MIIGGAALSHTTSAEDEESKLSSTVAVHVCTLISVNLVELKASSQQIGQNALKFLEVLKKEKPGSGNIAASANDVQKSIRQLERLAGVNSGVCVWGGGGGGC